jgi:predicted FMN-binding regulatory protein PaiB
VSQDEFERVLAALAADATFAQIMAHVTTRLKACHLPVDAAEHARAT